MKSAPASSTALASDEVEQMHGDAHPALVRFVDHGLVDLRRHLRRRSQVVVDADLHDVDLHRLIVGDQLARFVRRLRCEHRAGGEDAGAIERRGPLAVAQGEGRRLIVAEADDGGDAVVGIERAGRASRCRASSGCRVKADRAADVAVCVDEARDDGLARKRRCVRRRPAPSRAPPVRPRDDLAVAHDNRGVVDRRGGRAVHDARAGERFDGW